MPDGQYPVCPWRRYMDGQTDGRTEGLLPFREVKRVRGRMTLRRAFQEAPPRLHTHKGIYEFMKYMNKHMDNNEMKGFNLSWDECVHECQSAQLLTGNI